ncbi:hypothetical protein FKM82_006341 [Ascaphus truei]
MVCTNIKKYIHVLKCCSTMENPPWILVEMGIVMFESTESYHRIIETQERKTHTVQDYPKSNQVLSKKIYKVNGATTHMVLKGQMALKGIFVGVPPSASVPRKPHFNRTSDSSHGA